MARKPSGVAVAARHTGIATAAVSGGRFAIEYLNVMMEDADQDELVAALIRVARARGRTRLVEKIELNATALYHSLCMRANPELKSAAALLKAMGIRLTMQPIGKIAPAVRSAGSHRDTRGRSEAAVRSVPGTLHRDSSNRSHRDAEDSAWTMDP